MATLFHSPIILIFIFNGMIINLSSTGNKVFFRGSLPTYTFYWLQLVSKYSNKGILNDEVLIVNFDKFICQLDDNYDDWYSFFVEFTNTQVDDFDIGGYYDAILYGSNDTENFTQINKKLCRVINNWTTDTEYISNNEENKQFTYYRS